MPTNLFDLSGRIALITGASRGIGEATARLLAEQGAHVIISSRRQEALDPVAESIRSAGGQATAIAAHQGDSEALKALMERISSDFGKLDILVNNAATNPYFGHVLDTEPGMIDKTLQVNIKGYFELSQMAGQLMKRQKSGAIVNTASINGIKPGWYQGIYSVTKAAVINMTQSFAKECGPLGIRVNAVCPGYVNTPMLHSFFGESGDIESLKQAVRDVHPIRNYGEPEDIANLVNWLAGDEARYASGQLWVIDGGLSAQVQQMRL